MPEQAPPYPQGLGLRCRHLLAVDGQELAAWPIAEAAPAGPSTTGAGDDLRLYVAELFIGLAKSERNAFDHLGLVLVESRPVTPDGASRARVHVIGPESMRGHTSAIPSGLLIGRIDVTRLTADDHAVSMGVFRMVRGPGLRRVAEAIEALGAAQDHERDPEGSAALAQSILDRVELLVRSPDVSLIVAGRQTWSAEALRGRRPHYLGLTRGESVPADADLHVKDGHLCVGRTREVASPWREHEFVLLRLGPAAERRDLGRDIDQLRRQHALIQSGIALQDESPEPENYQDKASRLRLSNRLTARFGSAGAQRIPVVTPIAIEAAADLSQMLAGSEGDLHPQFARHLRVMRAGLTGTFGVDLPGVRLRINETDMPPGSYLFMLHEIPLVMGTIEPARALCSATEASLRLHGIQGAKATNPASGRDGSWIDRSDLQRAKDAGFETWAGDEYIVLHLSAVIRKNLSEFVGVQAVATLLGATKNKQSTTLVEGSRLPRFTSVLQALLGEEVPVTDLAAIGKRYLECEHLPIHEITEEIRCLEGVRPALPGNGPPPLAPVYRLGGDLLQLLGEGIRVEGDAAVLALEPEPTQEALAAVRNEVSAPSSEAVHPVVLVDDWRMRPFVRKLIELEFPHLWVLSRREALEPDTRPVLATITLE